MKLLSHNGLIIPLIIPYMPNGQIDDTALRRHAKRMVSYNAGALIVGGLAEETATLTEHDLLHVISTLSDELQAVLPLWGVITDPILKTAARTAKMMVLRGVSTVIVRLPHIAMRTPDGLIEFLRGIHQHCPSPLVLHMPGQQLLDHIQGLNNLVEDGIIHGIIDPGDSMSTSTLLLKEKHEQISFIAGSDQLCLAHMAQGGNGFISIKANAQPELWQKIAQAIEDRNWDIARSYFFTSLQLPNSATAIRTLLAHQGWIHTQSPDAIQFQTYADLSYMRTQFEGAIL
ncbi:dihydrodipicolinate synthase family protein [bacterium]|nr:dihydrodipicolinate synthase family protein [bacterium]